MAGFGKLVAGIATMAAVSWAVRRMAVDAWHVPAAGPDGAVTLRYGPVVGGTGVACFAFGLACAAIGLAQPPQPGDRVAWLALVLACCGGGAAFWLVARRHRLVVGQGGVCRHSLWRAPRALVWGDVRAVRFSRTSGYVTLEGAATRLRASVMLRGVSHLWEAIEANVPRDRWADARASFDGHFGSVASRAT
jgi:hypothetical protein